MTKTILAVLAVILVATFVAAADFDMEYTVDTPMDSFTYWLEGGESLSLNIMTQTSFGITVSNSSSITAPAGTKVLYGFTLTESSTPAQTIEMSYQYEEVTQQMYFEETLKFVAKVNGQVFTVPNAMVSSASMQLNATVSADVFNGMKSIEFAIVAVEFPVQPSGFGDALTFVASTPSNYKFDLADNDKLELDLSSPTGFDFTTTYYGQYNPTGVVPTFDNKYYFFEVEVKAAKNTPQNINGDFKYFFTSAKQEVASTLTVVYFANGQWKPISTVTLSGMIVTAAFQKDLGEFPTYNSKLVFAIVSNNAAPEPSDSTPTPTPSTQPETSVPPVAQSSGNTPEPSPAPQKSVVTSKMPEDSKGEVSGASNVRSTLFAIVVVVIVAVFGL